MADRRKRYKRPISVLLVALVLALLPLYNGLAIMLRTEATGDLPWHEFSLRFWVEHVFGYYRLFLILAPLPIGLGLIFMQRWAWWGLIAYSVVLVASNVIFIITDPALISNWSALIQTILVCSAMLFFLHKDISAPYMKMYPRGWRLQKRIPIAIPVQINAQSFTTRDIGMAGLYVKWPTCPLVPGSAVRIRLGGENPIELDGGVASLVDEHGVGIAFRNLDRDRKASLRAAIREAQRRDSQDLSAPQPA